MKKKIVAVILAALCLGAGIIGAAQLITDSMQAQEPAQAEAAKPLYAVYDKAPVYQAQLAVTSENAVFDKLNRSGKSAEEIYNDIFAYLRFKKMYAPSKQNMQYLDSLIVAGADVYHVIDIYNFWLTTSENISIVGDIYNRCPTIPGAYWIEDAFNQVTQNRHGVLDNDAINAYLSERVEVEDIRIANVLSRRGVLTVTQLLDRYAAGEQWLALAQYVEANAAAANGRQRTLPLTQIETATDLLAAIRFACTIPQENTAMVLAEDDENTGSTDAMLETMSEQSDQITSEIYAQLLDAGIFVRDGSDDENAQADAVLRQRATDNGLSGETIDSLLDEGYQLLDILNASEECKNDTSKSVETVLEADRAQQMIQMGVEQR